MIESKKNQSQQDPFKINIDDHVTKFKIDVNKILDDIVEDVECGPCSPNKGENLLLGLSENDAKFALKQRREFKRVGVSIADLKRSVAHAWEHASKTLLGKIFFPVTMIIAAGFLAGVFVLWLPMTILWLLFNSRKIWRISKVLPWKKLLFY